MTYRVIVKPTPLMRSALSFVPSQSLLRARGLVQTLTRLRGRVHEDDFRAFDGFRHRDPTVVDIGANRGQAIDSFFAVLGVGAMVIAFEPNPDLAEHLATRYRRRRVEVHGCGLAEQSGSVRLYLPRYGRTVWDTRASLDFEVARTAFAPEEFWWYSERRVGVDERVVTVRPLDDFDLAPQIVKIDVEGTGASVVRGGLRTIEEHRPVILAEGDALVDLGPLRDLGYRPYRYDFERREFTHGEGSLNTFMLVSEHRAWFARPFGE